MAILQKLKSWLPQTDIAPDPLNAKPFRIQNV